MKLRMFLLALVAVMTPVAAFAATDVHATGVDLRPLLQEVLLTVSAVVSLFAMWALRKVGEYIRAKTGVNVLAQEQMIRDYLEAAMARGLAYALAKVESADWASVEFKNELLTIASQYVLDAVPGALEHFGLDREALIERLVARLPELEASAKVATAAKAPARARSSK